MTTFTYVDHSQVGSYVLRGLTYNDGVKLFECVTEDIMAANLQFKEATGFDELGDSMGVFIFLNKG